MRYLKCKCGKREAWTTDGFQDCQGCPECGTTYAGHPDNHRPLQPHDWGTQYNENTGKPYKRCKKCYEIDEESYKESKNKDIDNPWKDILKFNGVTNDDAFYTPPLEEEGRIDEFPQDENIPTNLDEAIEILNTEENRQYAQEHEKNEFLYGLHHGFGTGIRNSWGLWHNSDLAQWFKERGIHHADDMSSIILTSYHRKVNGKDIKLEEQIKEYRDYWNSVDPNVNEGKL